MMRRKNGPGRDLFAARQIGVLVLLAILGTGVCGMAQTSGEAEQDAILRRMDRQAAHYGQLSRQIWEFAEVGYKEERSAALLKEELRAAGFRIDDRVAEIPTAFTATYGTGKPVIGLIGEYDALPGLSQEALPRQAPRSGGPGEATTSRGAGHGCGHNLFGVAAAFAAIVLKEYLVEHKLSGTIRFYGSPAEEGGSGKVFMARAGVFDDCDAILSWHPADRNGSGTQSTLANINARFRFRGVASHAAASPERGRSALDAVMLMAHAVDLLREHIPSATRIHYIVTRGGDAPNIVPEEAEIFLYARHPEMPVLDGIWQRILRCAEAGALATETQMETKIIGSVFNLLPNGPLAELYDRHLRRVGGVRYGPEERAFAEQLRQTLPQEGLLPLGSEEQIQPMVSGPGPASTDVGDVSWIAPTAEFRAATYVPGTPAHSWQAVACSGMEIGRRGMVVAAKTLALSGIELLTNPGLVKEARQDFERRRAGFEYRSRIPADQKPALNYRDR